MTVLTVMSAANPQELKDAHEKYVEGFVENYIKYYTDGSRSIACKLSGTYSAVSAARIGSI